MAVIKFGAKFPLSFAANLPQAIQDLIHFNPEIQELDVFFTPQFDARGFTHNDPAIKGHFWVMPQTPANFGGDLYNHNLWMAIYDSDYNIERHLRNEVPVEVNVNIHANTYSPPAQGGLNFQRGQNGAVRNVSFWSVIVEPQRNRAAVTLHWLVDDDQIKNAFVHALEHNRTDSFPEMVNRWDRIPGLNGTPLMGKLWQLIQI